jgi:hypothetical protein
MKNYNELSIEEIISCNGGSNLSDAFLKFVSECFYTDAYSQMYNAPYIVNKY